METEKQLGLNNEESLPVKEKKKRKVKPRVKVLVKKSGGPRPGSNYGRPRGEAQKNVLFQVPVRLDSIFRVKARELRRIIEAEQLNKNNPTHAESLIFKPSKKKTRLSGADPKKNVMYKVPVSLVDIFKIKVRELIAQLIIENPLTIE